MDPAAPTDAFSLAGPWWTAAVLSFVRVLPIVALTPAFGGAVVPARLRLAIAGCVALVLASTTGAPAAAPAIDAPALAGEVLVGGVLALYVRFLFEIAAAAGELVDLARGASQGQLFDPMTQATSTPFAALTSALAVVLYFEVGGPKLVLSAIEASQGAVPPGQVLTTWLGPDEAAATALRAASELFRAAVALAAPAVIVSFLIDLALALANRAASQIQVFFLGLPVKAVAVLGVMLIGFGASLPTRISRWLEGLVALAGGGAA